MVLRYVVVALLLVAGVLVLRWGHRRVDALGRPEPFPAISVTLCLVLAGAAAYPVLTAAWTERRLAEAGSQLAGVPMEVHCQTFGEASMEVGPELGYVRFHADGTPERRAVLMWEQCRDLRAWLRDEGRDATLDQVVAVHVLTHEAMHVAGVGVETTAECMAVQRDARTAELLGAAAVDARELASRYWREVYPRMPERYRSGECRAGGALDEGLAGAPWLAPTA